MCHVSEPGAAQEFRLSADPGLGLERGGQLIPVEGFLALSVLEVSVGRLRLLRTPGNSGQSGG